MNTEKYRAIKFSLPRKHKYELQLVRHFHGTILISENYQNKNRHQMINCTFIVHVDKLNNIVNRIKEVFPKSYTNNSFIFEFVLKKK